MEEKVLKAAAAETTPEDRQSSSGERGKILVEAADAGTSIEQKNMLV